MDNIHLSISIPPNRYILKQIITSLNKLYNIKYFVIETLFFVDKSFNIIVHIYIFKI